MSKKNAEMSKETMDLYEAVAAYVKAEGGVVLIAGGVRVIQMPDERPGGNWTLGIKCTGKPPKYAAVIDGAK